MGAYLDHAATTSVLPEVVEVVTAQMRELGNASSLHGPGRRARRVVEESRETIAESLGARPSEVVFTSGGTESDNLAVKGIYRSRRDLGARVLASAVEHHAVLDAVQWLGDAEGARVQWLPVDHTGRLQVDALAAALADDVALVTVMWANNEVGTLQPVDQVVAAAHAHGVPVHSDAIQAVGHVPVHFADSGLDALTITGHKIGGPIGVGALLVGREVDVVPLLHGGGQERDIRSGTLDTPAIAGLATAVQMAVKQQAQEALRLAALRSRIVHGVRAAVPDAILNGPETGGLPSIAHFAFPGCDGDSLLLLLDAQGIACSTGSACTAGVPQASHVLLAMGLDERTARGSLRFSFGLTTTEADVDAAIAAIGPAVERARRAGLVNELVR